MFSFLYTGSECCESVARTFRGSHANIWRFSYQNHEQQYVHHIMRCFMSWSYFTYLCKFNHTSAIWNYWYMNILTGLREQMENVILTFQEQKDSRKQIHEMKGIIEEVKMVYHFIS